jgi:serine/threonine protein kinase
VLQAGKFGKYEIIRKLSRSMTDVYLARDADAGRPVVLKLIEESNDEYTRVVIEAERRGANLQNKLHALDARVLKVYEYGDQDNCFFVALEYFEGRTLAEILIAEKRIEASRAAGYAAEICSQLRTLHSFTSDVNGRMTAVVHGDVKPSNIQIGVAGDLKLLDFGIAKMITATHNLTRHNLGSPSYCSPERLSSAQVDVHSDLWALGVTLFEMLSGAPPYQAQETRLLENLIQSRRPPRALPDDIPGGLRSIVSKSLAGDINHRYHSAQEFENDLRAFLGRREPIAIHQSARWDANATIDRQPRMASNFGKQTVAISQRMPLSPRVVDIPKVTVNAAPPPRPVPLIAKPKLKLSWKLPGNSWVIALVAGLVLGFCVLMPVAYFWRLEAATAPLRGNHDYAHDSIQTMVADWTLYKTLKQRNSMMGPFSPVAWAENSLHKNLIAAGDNIIDGYRASSDTRLSDFDWARARACLRYALQIEPNDSSTKGKLALAEGYANMVQNPRPPRASLSIDDFRQAASYLPKSPDPHLGLARLYVYAFRNIGEAMPEFQQAEKLGYQLGPREATEQADGYLFRSEWALSRARRAGNANKEEAEKWLDMAKSDAERARALYEPLVGYANVSANLEQVYQDRAEQIKLEQQALDTAAAKPVAKKSGFHKWQ